MVAVAAAAVVLALVNESFAPNHIRSVGSAPGGSVGTVPCRNFPVFSSKDVKYNRRHNRNIPPVEVKSSFPDCADAVCGYNERECISSLDTNYRG